MLSKDIYSVRSALKHRLRRDGEIRIDRDESKNLIANLDDWLWRTKSLERRSAPREVAREETVDGFRRAGCL